MVNRLTYIFVGIPWPCLIRSIRPTPFFVSSSASSFMVLSRPQVISPHISSTE